MAPKSSFKFPATDVGLQNLFADISEPSIPVDLNPDFSAERARESTTDSMNTHENLPSDDTDLGFSSTSLPGSSLTNANPNFFLNLNNKEALHKFGKEQAEKAGLGERLTEEVSDFIEMTNDERQVTQYVTSLQIRKRLEEREKAEIESWQISKALREAIKTYAQAAVLSPTLTSYRGNIPHHAVDAMYKMNAPGLPLRTQPTLVKRVETTLGNMLTQLRNIMKEKIRASLENGAANANIANLTHALINKTPIKATLQHYVRFAFLRWAVATYADTVSDDEFWLRVDDVMEEIAKHYKTATAIQNAYLKIFANDKLRYGNPEQTPHTTTEPRDVEKWQEVIAKHTSFVQGNAVTNVKKRKRRESEVEAQPPVDDNEGLDNEPVDNVA